MLMSNNWLCLLPLILFLFQVSYSYDTITRNEYFDEKLFWDYFVNPDKRFSYPHFALNARCFHMLKMQGGQFI